MNLKNVTTILFILASFLIVSCDKDTIEEPVFNLEQADQIADEDYAIYSYVVNEIYHQQNYVVKQKSITNVSFHVERENSNFIASLNENYPEFDQTLLTVMSSVNSSTILFGDNFTSGSNQIKVVSNEEISYIFSKGEEDDAINGGWYAFYDTYEGFSGILQFTRIAYNEDRTQAYLEFVNSYASLGADANMVYLVKENNSWIIKESFVPWVS